MLGAELVQIGAVLEHVHVERTFLQRQVGAHIVGELDQLDLVALLFEDGADALLDLVAEIAHGGADDDLLLGRVGRKSGAAGQQGGGDEGGMDQGASGMLHGGTSFQVNGRNRGMRVQRLSSLAAA